MDFTFKNMYKQNLGLEKIYDDCFDYLDISSELIEERTQDLNNLQKVLEEHNIQVHRPKPLTHPKYFTKHQLNKFEVGKPEFVHFANRIIESSASNVRDLTLVYGKNIIETPVSVRNRLKENEQLRHIFEDLQKRLKYNWFMMKQPSLEDQQKFDEREWQTINWGQPSPNQEFYPFIDAANTIKIGRDLIINVGNQNQYLGLERLKDVLNKECGNVEVHVVHLADSHIDGTLLPLRPGVFLANEMFLRKGDIKSQLPRKFQNWDIIYAQDFYMEDRQYWNQLTKDKTLLASSRGMDVNVLSLNEKDILINHDAVRTQDELYKNGFNPIPIRFRHGEIFAGGLHCSTLDLKRIDEQIDYTK